MDLIDQLLAMQEMAEVQYRCCRDLDRMDKPMLIRVWHRR